MRSHRSGILIVFFLLYIEILGISDPVDLVSYFLVSSWDPGDLGSSFFCFCGWILEILDPDFLFGAGIQEILDPDYVIWPWDPVDLGS